MRSWVLVLFAFWVWAEATTAPYLYSPPARFTFTTLDECRATRDLFLLLLMPVERVSGCNAESD